MIINKGLTILASVPLIGSLPCLQLPSNLMQDVPKTTMFTNTCCFPLIGQCLRLARRCLALADLGLAVLSLQVATGNSRVT